jgi:ectoine hydroxylase-related dioxygenase (phytanoyl-CoA dioxygenase family)
VARIIDANPPLDGPLSAAQRQSFQQNGFLHFRSFLDRAAVAQLWKAVEGVQAKWLAGNIKVVNGTPLKFGRDVDGRTIVQRFAFASQYDPVLHELLLDPRFKLLLDLAGPEARLGEDEKDGMVVNHYVNHSESNFTQMGWHTDVVRDLFLAGKILPMINLGIHLDDQDPRNGGLRLLPGTHHQNLWNILFRKKQFLDTNPDPREVAFDIKAGDLTLHDGRLWHRVERSRLTGEASRRRVIYIPIIVGDYQPKHANSRTPFYHRFQRLVK